MSINKNITIEGLGDDPSDTVLKQGNGIGSVYIFNVGEGKSFSISNLTIDGNELNSNGIITSEGNLNIQDIVFQNNKVYTGRGIVIKGNAVIDNFRLLGGIKSTGNGISISDGFAGTAEILNSSITGSAESINVGSSQATVTLSNNTISSSTIGVYVKTGATVNEIVSDASNIDEVENAIKTATIFESCGTDIQIQ